MTHPKPRPPSVTVAMLLSQPGESNMEFSVIFWLILREIPEEIRKKGLQRAKFTVSFRGDTCVCEKNTKIEGRAQWFHFRIWGLLF